MNYAKETKSSTVFKPASIDVEFKSKPLEKLITTQPKPIHKQSELTLKYSKESIRTEATARTAVTEGLVVHEAGQSPLKTEKRSASATSSSDENTTTSYIIDTILDRAYGDAKSRKRLLIVINPHGGPGKARHIFETECKPFLELANCEITIIETTHRYHAQEIASQTPDIADKYDAIVCCSGDGIPHELVNGFSKRTSGDAALCLASLPICQLPCGSGNSMAISLNGSNSPSVASLGIVKGMPMPVDLMLMTQGDNKCLSFLTQSFGTIADADLGTEHLRWMGGTRFVLGTLFYTLERKSYPCDVYVKYAHETRDQVKQHYQQHLEASASPETPSSLQDTSLMKNDADLLTPRFGTVNDPVPEDWTHIPDGDHLSLLYAGKMPWVSADCLMFPATLPTDGTMDIFITHTNKMGTIQSIKMLTSLEQGHHVHCDYTQYSKALAYRLVPKRDHGYLSIDGEIFPHQPFQVEVLPSAGCLLSTGGGLFTHTGY